MLSTPLPPLGRGLDLTGAVRAVTAAADVGSADSGGRPAFAALLAQHGGTPGGSTADAEPADNASAAPGGLADGEPDGTGPAAAARLPDTRPASTPATARGGTAAVAARVAGPRPGHPATTAAHTAGAAPRTVAQAAAARAAAQGQTADAAAPTARTGHDGVDTDLVKSRPDRDGAAPAAMADGTTAAPSTPLPLAWTPDTAPPTPATDAATATATASAAASTSTAATPAGPSTGAGPTAAPGEAYRPGRDVVRVGATGPEPAVTDPRAQRAQIAAAAAGRTGTAAEASAPAHTAPPGWPGAASLPGNAPAAGNSLPTAAAAIGGQAQAAVATPASPSPIVPGGNPAPGAGPVADTGAVARPAPDAPAADAAAAKSAAPAATDMPAAQAGAGTARPTRSAEAPFSAPSSAVPPTTTADRWSRAPSTGQSQIPTGAAPPTTQPGPVVPATMGASPTDDGSVRPAPAEAGIPVAALGDSADTAAGTTTAATDPAQSAAPATAALAAEVQRTGTAAPTEAVAIAARSDRPATAPVPTAGLPTATDPVARDGAVGAAPTPAPATLATVTRLQRDAAPTPAARALAAASREPLATQRTPPQRRAEPAAPATGDSALDDAPTGDTTPALPTATEPRPVAAAPSGPPGAGMTSAPVTTPDVAARAWREGASALASGRGTTTSRPAERRLTAADGPLRGSGARGPRDSLAADSPAAAATRPGAATFAQALAAAADDPPGRSVAMPPDATSPLAAAPVPGGTPSASQAPATAAAGPADAQIGAALGSPDFAPALGAQVTMFARDGVHEARLHLNPAEMGPITVHIALDGSAARVDFQADMAPTRQALEAALPALASALQDAGLTLAGGGVFQQSAGGQFGDQPGRQAEAWGQATDTSGGGQRPPSGNGRGPAGDSAGHGARDSGPTGGGTASAPRNRRGLVDLIA